MDEQTTTIWMNGSIQRMNRPVQWMDKEQMIWYSKNLMDT